MRSILRRSAAEQRGGARVVAAAFVVALGALALSLSGTVPSVAEGSARSTCGAIPQIHTHQFPESPSVTNSYQQMPPGMQFVYDGYVVMGGKRHPHQIVSTVTDLTKVIDGVRTIVVFEQDFQDGVLEESELFFVAQDIDGTVWHVGEYPEVYTDGQLSGAPDTWLSGVDGAAAGIDMPAVPHLGDVIVQGYSPMIRFWDCARFIRIDAHKCFPSGCYRNVAVTNEVAPYDLAGGHQIKYILPGVGTIAARPLGEPHPETVNLTSAAFLCPSAMDAIRQETVAQDQRAYHVASKVYSGSPPAAQTLRAGTC